MHGLFYSHSWLLSNNNRGNYHSLLNAFINKLNFNKIVTVLSRVELLSQRPQKDLTESSTTRKTTDRISAEEKEAFKIKLTKKSVPKSESSSSFEVSSACTQLEVPTRRSAVAWEEILAGGCLDAKNEKRWKRSNNARRWCAARPRVSGSQR